MFGWSFQAGVKEEELRRRRLMDVLLEGVEGGGQITVVAPKGSSQKKKTMELLRCLTYSDVLHVHFLNTWFLFSVSYKLSLLFLSALCVT